MISQQQIPEIDDTNKYNEEPNETEEMLQDLMVHCCVPWRSAPRKSFSSAENLQCTARFLPEAKD